MTHKGLKRQGSLYVLAVLCIIIVTGIIIPRLWPQDDDVQACTEYTRIFGENFDAIDFKDASISSVDGWPTSVRSDDRNGRITMMPLGSNFIVGAADSLGRRIYDCASGDFTGDGYPDLIGLDITGEYPQPPSTNPTAWPWSELRLIRSLYPTNAGAMPLFQVDMATSYEKFYTHTGPCAITAGDYNGDGLLDFFFMRNSVDQYGYTNFLAAMYINVGTATAPAFMPYNVSPNLNFTSLFQTNFIYCYWVANHFCSVDIDKDGDIDILVISRDRIYLLRNPGSSNFTLSAWTITELTTSTSRTGYSAIPGGSCVDAADFDGDGDYDIVCGSVGTYAYLAYYKNDGTGHFTRSTIAIPNPTCVGAVGIMGNDFTGDGLPDIFVATDSVYRGGTAQARIWIDRNRGLLADGTIDWRFQCLNACSSPTPSPYDIDMSTPLDYDQDGDVDIVVADANHSGDYYYIENELAGVYGLYGLAQSTNIGAGYLDPRLFAVTRVRVTSIRQGFLDGWSSDGLAVQVLFSNNGGKNWQSAPSYVFSGSGIVNATNLPWLDFDSFGSDLRWRIVLTAEEDEMADYDNASFETPYVEDLEIEFIYVDRREYSRASAAATIVTASGISKKLVIGSSFIFPGWEGQLRAYDVSAVSFTGGTSSVLQTITSSDLDAATGRTLVTGAEIFWDAGQMLDDRDPDARTIYTATRAEGDLINPLVRQNFTRSNAAALSDFLQDFQNDNAGLIDFVRGRDRYWKMGDINHSTPAVVGPPSGDPAYMGAGYDDFKLACASRPKVIYVGANDGMLHCFDVATGEELWGFIPYNLLPKLRNMYAVDPADSASRYYAHDVYCDGTPAVADVQVSGTWKTVLITGQGAGSGSTLGGGVHYYWALDVTDPTNPQPLWEISHKNAQDINTMGETWSTPAIGKVNNGGIAQWAAFMGSGYNSDKDVNGNLVSLVPGTYFYAVAIDDGTVIATDTITEIDTNSDAEFAGARNMYKYANIRAAIVASPTAVDLNRDGFTDSVFEADLDGRLYRMNVSGANPSTWKLTAIYTDYLNYPIITKPAAWVDPLEGGPARARVYFGTGGDDDAPADRDYSFVGIIDNGTNAATVEWYLGVPARLGLSETYNRGELGAGSKVWADPVIADQIIYFSTLRGSIEAVNPCLNLGEAGRLYARYLRYTSALPVGGTAFMTTGGTPPEFLQLVSKARQAVTVGEAERVAGRVNKREIYVQEYDSTLQKLEQPIGSLLRIKSWREIYKIIW